MQCTLAKACSCDTPVAPEEIGGRREQFHDCFLPITARKWCSTRKVMSHKKFPTEEFLPWYGILSEVVCLITFDTSFVYCLYKGKEDLLGGSRWRLQELMLVS